MNDNVQKTAATNGNPKPDLIAKTKEGSGKNASFDRVGAAWTREDGSIYLKLHGTQVVNTPIYLFPAAKAES